jgi:hypothetical protein
MRRRSRRATLATEGCDEHHRGKILRSAAVLVVVLVVGLAFSAVAEAAPGDLDPTFSGDGVQTTNLGPGGIGAAAAAILRQPDGKIIAGGSGGGSGFALTRSAIGRLICPAGSWMSWPSGGCEAPTSWLGGKRATLRAASRSS